MVHTRIQAIAQPVINEKTVDMGMVELFFGQVESNNLFKTEAIKFDVVNGGEEIGTTGDFFASATIVDKGEFQEVTVTPPNFKEFIPHNAKDGQVRAVGGSEDGDLTIADQEKIFDDLMGIGRLNKRRLRLIKNQAVEMITTGKITHKGATIDIGFTDITVLVGTDKWDDAGSDPIKQIEDAVEGMDIPADTVLMDKASKDLFLANTRVLTVAKTASGEKVNFYRAEAQEVREKSTKTLRYLGTVASNGVELYYEIGKYTDSAGASQTYMTANTVVFGTRNGGHAEIIYGGIPTVEGADGDNPRAVYVAGRTQAYASVDVDKKQVGVTLESATCPVMKNTKAFKVLVVA